MSESLNQGWNEAIVALALLGLRGVCLGPLRYLDSAPVLICRAWAWRETTAEPQPKQTDSWSARHAMQRHGGERMLHTHTQANTHTRAHTHTNTRTQASASLNNCHFTLKDGKFQLNWCLAVKSAIVCLGAFLYVLVEPEMHTSNTGQPGGRPLYRCVLTSYYAVFHATQTFIVVFFFFIKYIFLNL